MNSLQRKRIGFSDAENLLSRQFWMCLIGLSVILAVRNQRALAAEATPSRRTKSISGRISCLCRRVIRSLFERYLKEDDESVNDKTILTHTGACQCGAIQLTLHAPGKLYLYSDTTMKIFYRKVAIPVPALKITGNLQTFEDGDYVYTFCDRCGIHIVSGRVNQLFLNAQVLSEPSSIVFADTKSDQIQFTLPPAMQSTLQVQTAPEFTPEEEDDYQNQHSPDGMMLTATSSISKSFATFEPYNNFDNELEDDDLQESVYRMRKALDNRSSTLTTSVTTPIDEDDDNQTYQSIQQERLRQYLHKHVPSPPSATATDITLPTLATDAI